MSKKSLANAISKTIINRINNVAFEISYQTGLGWKYLPEDKYKDKNSRILQRIGYSPNNLLYKSKLFKNNSKNSRLITTKIFKSNH